MSKVVDKNGFILDALVRSTYERICDGDGLRLAHEKQVSAEAYLKLVLRLEKQGKLSDFVRGVR